MKYDWNGYNAVIVGVDEYDDLCIDTFVYKGYVGSIAIIVVKSWIRGRL